jgi:hypothetical protein
MLGAGAGKLGSAEASLAYCAKEDGRMMPAAGLTELRRIRLHGGQREGFPK